MNVPHTHEAARATLIEQARAVLLHNRKQGTATIQGQPFEYLYTCPSRGKYPHQWLWDSCFHAIVLSRLDPDAAKQELASLLRGIQPDGFLPNMILWQGTGSVMERGLTSLFVDGMTSRITQLPVVALAFEEVCKQTGDTAFIRQHLPTIQRYYGWLTTARDPDGDGLVSVIHPWETGVDASPAFDGLLGWPVHPHPLQVYRGLYGLLLRYRRLGWRPGRVLASNAFNVEHVLFNCIYAQGLHALARLCRAVQDEAGAANHARQADRVEQAILHHCWDEEAGLFYDLAHPGHRALKVATVSSLFPLILDATPKAVLDRLVQHLLDPAAFWTAFPVPSVSQREPTFNPADSRLLWRGPTWLNTNWFLVRGLAQHGYTDAARELARRTVGLVQQSGFWEFYNPLAGEPGGQPTFSWSTLVVDLLDYS